MPVNLDGLIFSQIMPDNSSPNGSGEFDTDLDGTTSQEDEFVSVTNTNSTPLDISGWQIWSDSTGGGADDTPQDGLFHTFPAGTVIAPGDTLWVINEITGTLAFAQEASEGGAEGGPTNTNLLTEGSGGSQAESIALYNPDTNEYIVFNMSPNAPQITSVPGFPSGATEVGEIDGDAVFADPGHGFSYQYDAATDTYIYAPAFIPCFAEGTLIETPDGARPIERLKAGDLVLTRDDDAQPVLWTGATKMDFANEKNVDQRPIEFKPGSLGPALPTQTLVVSPQHKMLMIDATGAEVLAPAAGLTERRFVRIKKGAKSVTWYHLLLPKHAIITSNGVPTESFYPGDQAMSALPVRHRLTVMAHFPQTVSLPAKARPFLTVRQTLDKRATTLRPACAVLMQDLSDETSLTATA